MADYKLSNYTPALKPTGLIDADLGGKGATGSPAYLKLTALDGTEYFLYVRANADVAVHTAIPTVDTDGTIVGTQA